MTSMQHIFCKVFVTEANTMRHIQAHLCSAGNVTLQSPDLVSTHKPSKFA